MHKESSSSKIKIKTSCYNVKPNLPIIDEIQNTNIKPESIEVLTRHETSVIDALFSSIETDESYDIFTKENFVQFIKKVKHRSANSSTFYIGHGHSALDTVSENSLETSTVDVNDLKDSCKIGQGGGGTVYMYIYRYLERDF